MVKWVHLFKSLIERVICKKLQLVEIFKDYKVIVNSVQKGKTERLKKYEIVPKPKPKHVTVESLRKYVERLAMHHPEEGFILVKKGKYYVITKKKTDNVKPYVPIYFDLEKQKFYIEKKSTETPQLTNYIIMRTLGALGISQSKYIRKGVIEGEK